MYINRAIIQEFKRKLQPNKVLLILGARRVGKTKLISIFLEDYPKDSLLKLNGEDLNDVALLKDRSVKNYQRLTQGIDLLVIDEAQHIPDIGYALKLLVDSIDGLKIIATGSSVFDMTNKIGEPLVGRKNTLHLFPLAQIEFSKIENFKQTSDNLEQRLIFGGYPELEHYQSWQDKQDYLYEIVNSYLLKDILVFDGIKNADKIYNLLRLIAFQIGKEVSVQELGNQLQLAKNTVSRYLDLLAKIFVIYKVEGFSRNLRKEITKTSRWYFYDNGIRNALIKNFNVLNNRNDVGELWENYLAAERLKKQHYTKINVRNYFWRTYDQQELDWLEEDSKSLSAYEFKWNPSKKSKVPTAFSKAYPEATFLCVTKENYLDFIT